MRHTHIAKHMSSVEAYRERLAVLQGAWDTLSLLSHLAADSSDMSGTRQAFESLAADLVTSLTAETHKKSLLALKACSQIAIDVLVRNLYERTADIGFLSADQDLCKYAREVQAHSPDALDAQRRDALLARLRAYVAKYSVYRDIALLASDGTVLLQLDSNEAAAAQRTDPLIAQTLSTRAPYVETYRYTEVFSKHERSLVYSHRVGQGSASDAVLCLSFDLDDEVKRIFSKLSSAEDWALYAFVDANGEVIASSDPWQLPRGAKVPLALEESGGIVRFAGREYLATTRSTPGYQGYLGPGWLGHAMIPLEHAFEQKSEETHSQIAQAILKDLADSELLFCADLRRIPHQARRIQEELNRSVWNGNVRLATRSEAGSSFAKALLREIGNAGRRTQETFERSIADLQGTVTSATSHSAKLFAELAVDILDRNLYERANDCRWWALNATLIDFLRGDRGEPERVAEVLRHINSLYTVYDSIVLFDATGKILAVSNAKHAKLIGKTCGESWVHATLALRDAQAFAVSPFTPSVLYDNRPTLIFGAALGIERGAALGGIGIVFDSEPQFAAMLKDALPRSASGEIAEGCLGLFVDSAKRVISATALFQPGELADLPDDLLSGRSEAGCRVVEYRGIYYAASISATSGYREYVGMGALGIVLIPLGPRPNRVEVQPRMLASPAKRASPGEQTVEIATFLCSGQWLGLLRDHIVEAVDGSSLRIMPGKPAWYAGLLMYRGEAISVIDVAQLLGGEANPTRKEVIIVQPRNHRARVGLLVDELASIPEVPVTSLLPLAECAGRGAVRIVDRAVRPEQAQDPLLLIVNIDQVIMATREEKRSTVSST